MGVRLAQNHKESGCGWLKNVANKFQSSVLQFWRLRSHLLWHN